MAPDQSGPDANRIYPQQYQQQPQQQQYQQQQQQQQVYGQQQQIYGQQQQFGQQQTFVQQQQQQFIQQQQFAQQQFGQQFGPPRFQSQPPQIAYPQQEFEQPQYPQQFQQPQQFGQPQQYGYPQQFSQPQQFAPQPQQQVQFDHQTYLELPKGDETLPWRRSKTPKIRSRSLQPVRDIEKLPWLRSAQRDRSLPKQPTFMQMHRGKVPVRPWIEEVIKLKRTELHQKVIERAKIEKVQLKESHIERKEIPHEELEKVDLKHLEWDADAAKPGQLTQLAEWQQALLSESAWSKHHITHEDQMTILELTKQIDEIVHADKSQGVPWEVQMQQLKTIERTQKLIDKFKVEDVGLKSMRQQTIQQQHRKISTEQRQYAEDSKMLRIDQRTDIQQHRFDDQQQFMQQQQQQPFVQPLSHTEDMSVLKLTEHTKLDMRNIQQVEQETPYMWQRGTKQQQSDQGALSYVEDSTVLSVKKTEKITQKFVDLNETAVAWNRGQKPQGSVVSDSQVEILQVQDDGVEQEEQPLPWMRGKKVTKGTASHVEDTTLLKLDERQDIQRQQLQTVEQSVMWQRGKKHLETATHREDETTLVVKEEEEEQQEDLQEQPTPWIRGKKVSKGAVSHVEDATVLKLDENQRVVQQEITPEVPVMWKRGPKPQDVESLATEELVPQRRPSIPKPPVEKVKPWTEEQVKLKPPRKESLRQERAESLPKQPEEKVRPWTEEQVTLKTARRESIEIAKPIPAKDEVQLKPIKTKMPQVQEPASEKPEVKQSFFFNRINLIQLTINIKSIQNP